MLTLYYAPGAASLAVHWMLIEIGAPFETVALDFEKNDQKRPDFLKINPVGMVPTLVDDGEVYTEAAAILTWLAERHPEAGFSVAPDDPRLDGLVAGNGAVRRAIQVGGYAAPLSGESLEDPAASAEED